MKTIAPARCAFLFCSVWLIPAAVHTQQVPAPIRPTSDSSFAPPDKAGTNFLVPQQTVLASSQQLEQVLQKRRETRHKVQLILPTSDRANDSESQIRDLELQLNPNAVSVGQLKAYTNYAVPRFIGEPQIAVPAPSQAPSQATPPGTIRKLYGVPPNGGSGVIAIVSAYHYPNVAADLNTFAQAYKLPVLPPCPPINPLASGTPCIKVDSSPNAPLDCNWNQESAADLQWAHAIAPGATLLFVEAPSETLDDLFAAVTTAQNELKSIGGEISISWSSKKELVAYLKYSSIFTDGILYFAAVGDSGGQVAVPASFSNVVAVGGTSLLFAPDGSFISESGWQNSGGGVSSIVTQVPPYQVGVENLLSGGQNVPDIAAVADADYQDGLSVEVYVTTPVSQCQDAPTNLQYNAGWMPMVGTSLSTPIIAAITNVSQYKRSTVAAELKAIYANRKDPSRIRDIVLMDGAAGNNVTKPGYDNVTGVGVPASMTFDAPPPP